MIDLNKKIEILHSLLKDNQASRDQALLALSSATLGFTITVVEKLYQGAALWLAIFSWTGLSICILSLLCSYGSAAAVSESCIEFEHTEEHNEKVRLYKRAHFFRSITIALNRTTLISYIMALSAFVLFAAWNALLLDKERKMPPKPSEIQQRGFLPSASMMPKQPVAVPPQSQPTSQPSASSQTPAAPNAPTK